MSPTAPQGFGTPLLLEDYLPITPPVTATSPPLCAVCHTPTSPLCSTCKSLHYCSTACQTHDWALHKLLCKAVTTTAHAVKRPDTSYRRAFYLSDTSSKPRFIWLQYSDDGRPLDMARCFPGTNVGEIKTIAFHDRFLPYWIQISYDSNVSGRVMGKNACLQRLLETSSETSSSSSARAIRKETGTGKSEVWRGALIMLAYSAEEGLGKPALDVDPGLLSPVVEYMRLRMVYEGPIFVEQPQEWYAEKEWEKLFSGVGQ